MVIVRQCLIEIVRDRPLYVSPHNRDGKKCEMPCSSSHPRYRSTKIYSDVRRYEEAASDVYMTVSELTMSLPRTYVYLTPLCKSLSCVHLYACLVY